MIEISIVYSDPEQIHGFTFEDMDGLEVTAYDENNYKQRRMAFKIKGSVAARKTPLVVIKIDGRITKAFYREEFKDPLKELNKWLDDYKNCERLDLKKLL